MRLKYNCQVYDTKGKEFTILSKGTQIKVLNVTKSEFKISWNRAGENKFAFMGFKQFFVCVDQRETFKTTHCPDCKKFGNCTIRKKSLNFGFIEYCAYFESKEEN